VRTWTIDQFEFRDRSSEEHLEVSAASRSEFPFPDVRSFVDSAVGGDTSQHLPEPSTFDELAFGEVRAYLAHFCGIEVPTPCSWPTYRIGDSPDEWHIVVCTPNGFIQYLWSTSA
jgi:hypothetical protein